MEKKKERKKEKDNLNVFLRKNRKPEGGSMWQFIFQQVHVIKWMKFLWKL